MEQGTPQDLDQAMNLVQSCVSHMLAQGIEQWDEVYPDRETLRKDIARGNLFLARDQTSQDLAGIVVLDQEQALEYKELCWQYPGPSLVVHRLSVAPGHQGKGLASAMMDFVEAWGREQGFASIRLDAYSLNPAALRLYEKRRYLKAGSVTFRKGVFHCYEKRLGPVTSFPHSA